MILLRDQTLYYAEYKKGEQQRASEREMLNVFTTYQYH